MSSKASNRLATIASHFAPATAKSEAVQTIAVFGAGSMGAGVAVVAATAGFRVILADVNQKALDTGIANIKKSLSHLAKKFKMPNADQLIQGALASIETTTDSDKAAGDADLIIEAIVENLDIKRKLFKQLDTKAKPECIFASNTSSLLIGDIAEAVPDARRKRFAGLHFFNPVPMMQLVEVIRTPETSDEVVEALHEVCKRMGKVPVLAKDKPGFIVNRLLSAYTREAVKMYERGDASFEDIDTAMKLGAGHPMGPFRLMDMVGVDVNFLVAQAWVEYGKRGLVPDYLSEPPSGVVSKMMEEGKLGIKTGQGWYDYSKKEKKKQ